MKDKIDIAFSVLEEKLDLHEGISDAVARKYIEEAKSEVLEAVNEPSNT